MKALYEKFLAIFHREVSDIMAPVHKAIARIEVFESKIANVAREAKAKAIWAEGETQKAARIGDKLRDLVK